MWELRSIECDNINWLPYIVIDFNDVFEGLWLIRNKIIEWLSRLPAMKLSEKSDRGKILKQWTFSLRA